MADCLQTSDGNGLTLVSQLDHGVAGNPPASSKQTCSPALAMSDCLLSWIGWSTICGTMRVLDMQDYESSG